MRSSKRTQISVPANIMKFPHFSLIFSIILFFFAREKNIYLTRFYLACELINFHQTIPISISDSANDGYRIVAEGRSIIPENDVNFLAPITRMDKLACIGLNYSGHCQEQGIPTPESPVVFSKFASNIIGPRDNILLPQISDVSGCHRVTLKEIALLCEG